MDHLCMWYLWLTCACGIYGSPVHVVSMDHLMDGVVVQLSAQLVHEVHLGRFSSKLEGVLGDLEDEGDHWSVLRMLMM